MANVAPIKGIDIAQELKNLELYKYHPSGILQVSLNRLQDMLDGKVIITEPSNPFTYLLETSSLNTAFAVQEFTLLTRKLYPRLANNENDLYLHMSDYDFLGRFAEPSYANVLFNILFNDFKNKATYNPIQKEYVFKIPRHLKVTVSGYTYMLTSAIVIRQTENDIIDVKFENQDFNNLFPITTNYINFVVRKLNQEETYLSFALKLPEVDIDALDISVDLTTVCRGTVPINAERQFYFFRAFFQKDGDWVEMLVTHTNEVYDILTPTCIIKVLANENLVDYHIPAVYLTTGMIGVRLRFLVYTTMGKISVNFGDYQISEFVTEYADVFPETELDQFTRPLQNISKIIYTTDIIDSGKNAMGFEELKDAVINNSIGDRKLPITAKQLSYSSGQKNFNIIKDVDVVTNRMYKLETSIPFPLTRYPITRFNLDILEFQTKISELRLGNNVTDYNENVTVIPAGTMFRLDGGILTHISQQESDQIKALSGIDLITAVNDSTYLSTYYHYVIDTGGNRTTLRAYDLTTPLISSIGFKIFNPTARIGVNTTSTNLFKTPTGYSLDVLGNLKKYTETITQDNVIPYLVFTVGVNTRYFLEGTLYTMLGEQPVYRFDLNTNYFITADNRLAVSNFQDANGALVSVELSLADQLELLYTSDVIPFGFIPTEADDYINTSFLSGARCVVTTEDINFEFGIYLERLYSGVHTSTGTFNYALYPEDVVMRYSARVYGVDNTVLHEVGDIVRNPDDTPVIASTKGDVILDINGLPTPLNQLELVRYLNLLFIDYRTTLVTQKNSKDHDTQIRRHITEVVSENAVQVQNELLDNSEAFVVVPKSIGATRVKTTSKTYTIPSMQAFTVDVYVNFDVYNNNTIRETISYTIIKEVDEYFHNRTLIKRTELLNIMYVKLREFVVSVSLTGFTELDEEYLEVIDKNARLSLSKTLVQQADGYELKEDIVVKFCLVD